MFGHTEASFRVETYLS